MQGSALGVGDQEGRCAPFFHPGQFHRPVGAKRLSHGVHGGQGFGQGLFAEPAAEHADAQAA